jgi:glycosyltransferase involved in cell wall biosynthesis
LNRIIHIISGLDDGGAESLLFSLLSNDNSNTHYVISLTSGGKYGEKLKEKNIEIFFLRIKNIISFIKAIVYCNKLLNKIKPDTIQTWMTHANLFSFFLISSFKKNLVWSVHFNRIILGKFKLSTICAIYFCVIGSYFSPRKIICVSNSVRDNQVKIKMNRKKLIVINNGINTNYFIPDLSLSTKSNHSFKLNDRPFKIGMAARFDGHKDHKSLLEAIKLLKDNKYKVDCYLVGQGVDEKNEELKNLINLLGINSNIYLMGSVDDIRKFYQSIDLHILSSFSEASPLVIIESMSCGIPNISTRVGDAPFMISETGWIVPIAKPKILYQTIIQSINEIIFMHDIWIKRKINCRERVKKSYEIERMIDEYNQIWSLNIS